MARERCPECGGPLLSGRCPNCQVYSWEKNTFLPYFAIAGFGVAALILAAIFLFNPGYIPGSTSSPAAGSSGGMAAPPSVPTCTVGMSSTKVPPSLVRLMVTSSTCSPGEITGLQVTINGAGKGTLPAYVSACDTFVGVPGLNNVIVTAKYANGAEMIVYTGVVI